jgi:hypothetical protein
MAISVVPIVKDWKWGFTATSSFGTRVYVDAALLPHDTPVNLPELYDYWSTTYPTLFVTNITERYLPGGCGKEYIVEYSFTGDAKITYTSEYPETMQISSEYGVTNDSGEIKYSGGVVVAGAESVTVGKAGAADVIKARNHWKWPDGVLATDLRRSLKGAVIQYTIPRQIFPGKMDEFVKLSMQTMGKINNNTFQEFAEGSVLYIGAQAQEGIAPDGSKKWNVELRFKIRVVNGSTYTDSWLYQYKPSQNEYVLVMRATDNSFLYKKADFSKLLSEYTTIPTY